jgi:hypothetical protein
MSSVGRRYTIEYRYRPRPSLIPDSMNPALREYSLPRGGIALRSLEEPVDQLGRVRCGAAARDETSKANE